MMDYKKLAEEAREFSITCDGMGLSSLSSRFRSYADAIEILLETVEAMKNPHIKIQIGCEELTIKEVCDKIERLKEDLDKAVEMLHQSAVRDKSCLGCKNLKTKCDHVYICRCDGEDRWEWEGLNGKAL